MKRLIVLLLVLFGVGIWFGRHEKGVNNDGEMFV